MVGVRAEDAAVTNAERAEELVEGLADFYGRPRLVVKFLEAALDVAVAEERAKWMPYARHLTGCALLDEKGNGCDCGLLRLQL